MKVIFLDFDGVLVVPPNLRNLEQHRVALVSEIMERTGAQVVVSSTWRLGREKDELSHLLGFQVYDVTPDLTRLATPEGNVLFASVERGTEIAAWLKKHPEVKEYVVLDDDSDRGPIPEERWILTSFRYGLQPAHVPIAIDVLEGRA